MKVNAYIIADRKPLIVSGFSSNLALVHDVVQTVVILTNWSVDIHLLDGGINPSTETVCMSSPGYPIKLSKEWVHDDLQLEKIVVRRNVGSTFELWMEFEVTRTHLHRLDLLITFI